MDELKKGLKLLDDLQATFTDHYLKVCACIDSSRRSLLNQQQYGKQSEVSLTSPTQKTNFLFDTSESMPEQPTSSKTKTDFPLDVYEAAPKSSNISELIQKKLETFRSLPAFDLSQKTKNAVKPKFKLWVEKASVQAKMRVDESTPLDNNSEANAQAESSSTDFNQGILDMFGNSESISSSHTDVSTSSSEQQISPSGSSELPTFSSFNDFSSFSLFSDPSVFSSSADQSVTDSLPVNDAPPLVKEEKQAEKEEVTVGYKCSVCNKVFKSYQYMKYSHMNVHNGKRFKCSYCSYTSAYYGNTYTHEKVCAKKPKKAD